MSFFDQLFADTSPTEIKSINELYNSLDAKSSHAALRTIQKECIDLIDNRLDANEIILKLSTGSGKTTIGLLYLKYYAQKYNEPTLFLTANTQLAKQVVLEASNLGLSAKLYGQGDNLLDHHCSSGKTILVSTYEKLFNGRSTFKTYKITPCAIVFDDAHTGMDLIKKQFSLVGSTEIYSKLVNILKEACNKHDPIAWLDLTKHAIPFEVPYWIWQENLASILELLNLYQEEFKFVYPLIKNELKFSRCIITADKFEITPDIINIKAITPYYEAKHKLFMSATYSESDNFIRILGLKSETVKNILSPKTDKGIGERMILVPALASSNIEREEIIDLCREYSHKYSVFILTSSFDEATDWVNQGALLLNSDNIQEELEQLKQNKHGLFVMAQRFEGLDLADDLCRILVIDGIPHGERIIEHYDAENLGNIGGLGKKNIFRIEQGMGRAVRSPVDYAVVLLIGNDLSSFIARKECKQALSPETNCQLELGIRMSQMISNDQNNNIQNLQIVIDGCLSRDQKWKNGYQNAMKNIEKEEINISIEELNIAKEERLFYEKSYNNQFLENQESFNDIINKMPDSKPKGKLFENLARVINLHDPVLSQQIQNKAKDLYPRAITPITLLPKKVSISSTESSINISSLIKKYDNYNGIIIDLKTLKDNFGFNDKNSRKIEKNYQILGEFLGASSTNPEYELRKGPDVCWYLDDKVIVIEVKHNKEASLHKKEAGQLSTSFSWAQEVYPPMANIIPVTMTNVTTYDSDAYYIQGTLLLNEENTIKILNSLISFYQNIILNNKTLPLEISVILKQYNLDSNSLLTKYFLEFSKFMKRC